MRTESSIVLDGQVFAHRKAGMYRYASELLRELDSIVDRDSVVLVVPKYATNIDNYKKIKVVKYGNVKGIMWTQTSLLMYCIMNKKIPLGFTNTTPILMPGYVVVHDIGYKLMRRTYRNIYGKLSSLWHRLNYWVIANSGKEIITVSNTSKKEIVNWYKVSPERIFVISNGWQHYKRIKSDDQIKQKFPMLSSKNYYYAMGSSEERKNFKWVVEVAKRNPERLFVISGKNEKNAKYDISKEAPENLIMTGYVSDGEARWLMENARAFLFPSIYEGFGIPPMEALSVGTKVLCSNASCMPEIYEDAVGYFSPYDYDVNLSQLESETSDINVEHVLGKYSWEKSAHEFKAFLERVDGK